MFNWRPNEAIRGMGMVERHHQLGRVGRMMWQAATSIVVAPSVSIKDQVIVGPREQVLNVMITC
jgi:hypothetical protein